MTFKEYDNLFYSIFIEKEVYENVRELLLSNQILPAYNNDNYKFINYFSFKGERGDDIIVNRYIISHTEYYKYVISMFNKNSKLTEIIKTECYPIESLMNIDDVKITLNYIYKLYVQKRIH